MVWPVHKTLIVVADGSKALFTMNRGDEEQPILEEATPVERENPPTREQGTDKPGRFHDAGRGGFSGSDDVVLGRSAVGDTDWHRFEKHQFAKEIAGRLNKLALGGGIDRIVLVAPPQVLGDLRKELHKVTTEKVVAEIQKDLTNFPTDRIAAEVREVLKAA
jgi:protein required for attachment to host cells